MTVETGRAQDYFSGPPDFAVEFAQAGLQWAREHGATAAMVNLRDLWQHDLFAGMEYVAWRLQWDVERPVPDLVAEWLCATVGPEIADRATEMLLDLDDIYRDGFHVRGAAYHTWEPLRHVRTGWVCKGNPFIDSGRGQHRFLRDHYLMAKPELELAIRTMRENTERYDRWLESYRGWMRELPDPQRGQWLEVILERGQYALHINLAYVTAFLRYFDYEDNPDDVYLSLAKAAVTRLEEELELYRRRSADYGNRYMSAANVQGIDEFLKFVRRGMDDLEGAKRAMAEAPDDAGVARILDDAQVRDADLIDSTSNAHLYMQWKGCVDGRDVIRISVPDGTTKMEHFLGDHAGQDEITFNPSPQTPGRYAVKMHLGAERGRVYILDRPSEENGMVLSILLDDRRAGYGSYDFSIYHVPD